MIQISDEWLLSAAQCVDGKHAAAIQVKSSLALFSSSLSSQLLVSFFSSMADFGIGIANQPLKFKSTQRFISLDY